eukprot:COSAG01_NODE_2002_length_8672_cov_53.309227_2_plen_203_part_00
MFEQARANNPDLLKLKIRDVRELVQEQHFVAEPPAQQRQGTKRTTKKLAKKAAERMDRSPNAYQGESPAPQPGRYRDPDFGSEVEKMRARLSRMTTPSPGQKRGKRVRGTTSERPSGESASGYDKRMAKKPKGQRSKKSAKRAAKRAAKMATQGTGEKLDATSDGVWGELDWSTRATPPAQLEPDDKKGSTLRKKLFSASRT